eukprot:2112696-Amphidinium_carterae.1
MITVAIIARTVHCPNCSLLGSWKGPFAMLRSQCRLADGGQDEVCGFTACQTRDAGSGLFAVATSSILANHGAVMENVLQHAQRNTQQLSTNQFTVI